MQSQTQTEDEQNFLLEHQPLTQINHSLTMPALSQTGVASDKENKSTSGSFSGGRRASRSSATLQGNRRGSGVEKLDSHVSRVDENRVRDSKTIV